MYVGTNIDDTNSVIFRLTPNNLYNVFKVIKTRLRVSHTKISHYHLLQDKIRRSYLYTWYLPTNWTKKL